MLRDDASPEELERWYRRTPDEIEAEKRNGWSRRWAALRTPEHLARAADTVVGGRVVAPPAAAPRRVTSVGQAAPPNSVVRVPDRIEAYERGPDGKLRFTPEYARRADGNYDALKKAQDDINYWTGLESLPAFLRKETGPLGLMLSGAGLLTGTLSRYATPPPGYEERKAQGRSRR